MFKYLCLFILTCLHVDIFKVNSSAAGSGQEAGLGMIDSLLGRIG